MHLICFLKNRSIFTKGIIQRKKESSKEKRKVPKKKGKFQRKKESSKEKRKVPKKKGKFQRKKESSKEKRKVPKETMGFLYYLPVEPNPPPPRTVSSLKSNSAFTNSAKIGINDGAQICNNRSYCSTS